MNLVWMKFVPMKDSPSGSYTCSVDNVGETSMLFFCCSNDNPISLKQDRGVQCLCNKFFRSRRNK